jgi:hypothetical protein
MHIHCSDSDRLLTGRIRRCSRELAELRAAKTSLGDWLSRTAEGLERSSLQSELESVMSRGAVLDLELSALQSEQRKNFGQRGKAIATCRVDWP